MTIYEAKEMERKAFEAGLRAMIDCIKGMNDKEVYDIIVADDPLEIFDNAMLHRYNIGDVVVNEEEKTFVITGIGEKVEHHDLMLHLLDGNGHCFKRPASHFPMPIPRDVRGTKTYVVL